MGWGGAGDGGLVGRGMVQAVPGGSIAGRPGRLFYFGSLVILDVACRYLSLFLEKKSKNIW